MAARLPTQLSFAEADATTVREAVRRSLGAGTERRNDCGAVVVQHDGLLVVLRGARFVGWSATPGAGPSGGVIVAVASDDAVRLATVDPSGLADATFSLVMRAPGT